MNKRTLATLIISHFLVNVIALSVVTLHGHFIPSINSTFGDASYTLTINKNSNHFNNEATVSGEGTGTITNQRGNEFQFKYDALSIGDADSWQVMETFGYLRNLSPICGITSIEITTYGIHAFNIYYGASYDDVDSNHITIDSAVTHYTYDLSAFLPNFFKITPHVLGPGDMGAPMFTELKINYSCVQTNCWVNATSSNTTYGTVTGGGIYHVGEEVTLTASPITDYEDKVYGIFQGWYDGETLLSNELTYTFTPTLETYSYNCQAKFVEANSEEFTSATRLYYGDGSSADPVSGLRTRGGRFYILASYSAYNLDDPSANVGPDGQPFDEENKVFVSVGRGPDKDTNDIYLNRKDNFGVYWQDSGRTIPAYINDFYSDIESIDFYIDISDPNYINGFELSIDVADGVLGKYDVVDEKSARVTLYNGYFNYIDNDIAIKVPDRISTSRKLTITKIVIHYKNA